MTLLPAEVEEFLRQERLMILAAGDGLELASSDDEARIQWIDLLLERYAQPEQRQPLLAKDGRDVRYPFDFPRGDVILDVRAVEELPRRVRSRIRRGWKRFVVVVRLEPLVQNDLVPLLERIREAAPGTIPPHPDPEPSNKSVYLFLEDVAKNHAHAHDRVSFQLKRLLKKAQVDTRDWPLIRYSVDVQEVPW